MARIPVPFVGWRGRVFVFKTNSVTMKFSGPKHVVEFELRQELPAFRRIAAEKGDSELVTLLDAAIADLRVGVGT